MPFCDSALGVFKQPDWHVNFNRGLIWDLIWAFFWAIWDLIWQKFCGCDLIWDLICLSLLAGGLIWDLIWWMFEQPDLICGLIWQVFWHCDLIWGLIWKLFKPLIWFEIWFDFQKADLSTPTLQGRFATVKPAHMWHNRAHGVRVLWSEHYRTMALKWLFCELCKR